MLTGENSKFKGTDRAEKTMKRRKKTLDANNAEAQFEGRV